MGLTYSEIVQLSSVANYNPIHSTLLGVEAP